MGGLGGPDEAIERDIKPLVHLPENGRHFLGKLGRLDAPLARRLGHFQAMLVGAGQEEDVAAHRSRWKRAMTSVAIAS